MLYGATNFGGANGSGLLFRMTTDGSDLTELHAFSGSDGAAPNGVIVGADGHVYGTTRFGGDFNQGSVFRMSPDGTGFVTLRLLSGLDGVNPAALLQLPDGRLVGTTQNGGANGHGTVFMMRPDGKNFEVIHAFGGPDGMRIVSPVVADASGTLYGTTARGGPRGGASCSSSCLLLLLPWRSSRPLRGSGSRTATTSVPPSTCWLKSFKTRCSWLPGSSMACRVLVVASTMRELRTIALTPATVNSGTTLSIRLSVRVAANSRHRSGTARLWFNDAGANTHLKTVSGEAAANYYLLDGFTLGTGVGIGPRKTRDVLVDRARDGNAFKAFGTWSLVVQ